MKTDELIFEILVVGTLRSFQVLREFGHFAYPQGTHTKKILFFYLSSDFNNSIDHKWVLQN